MMIVLSVRFSHNRS